MTRPKASPRKLKRLRSASQNKVSGALPIDICKSVEPIVLGKGCRYCNFTYYVSEIEVDQASVIYAATQLNHPTAFLYRHIFQNEFLASTVSLTNFIAGPTETLKVDHGVRTLNGAYLVVCVPYLNEPPDEISRASRVVASSTRLILGDRVIKNRQYEFSYDYLDHCSSIVPEQSYFVRPFVSQLALDFEAARELHRKSAFNFVERSLELIDMAINQRDSVLRFIQLWLALEAQVGNGKDRSRFSKDILNSHVVDAELNRLRNIRGRCLHDAALVDNSFIDEYSMLSIIRLAATTDLQFRALLLKQYEEAIQNPSSVTTAASAK